MHAGWWRKWLDYVNFDYTSREDPRKKRSSEPGSSKKMQAAVNLNEAKFRDELLQLKQMKNSEKSYDRSQLDEQLNKNDSVLYNSKTSS